MFKWLGIIAQTLRSLLRTQRHLALENQASIMNMSRWPHSPGLTMISWERHGSIYDNTPGDTIKSVESPDSGPECRIDSVICPGCACPCLTRGIPCCFGRVLLTGMTVWKKMAAKKECAAPVPAD